MFSILTTWYLAYGAACGAAFCIATARSMSAKFREFNRMEWAVAACIVIGLAVLWPIALPAMLCQKA
jgi:hypothetical protein